jgi:hypothetical protein
MLDLKEASKYEGRLGAHEQHVQFWSGQWQVSYGEIRGVSHPTLIL